MSLEITIFNSILPGLWQNQRVIWILRCSSSAAAQVVPEFPTPRTIFESLLFFKCPLYGNGKSKRGGKKKKKRLFWFQANLCWRLPLFLSCLYWSCRTLTAPERFSSMAFKVWRSEVWSWKSIPLLSSIPTEETTDNPLFRALVWNSWD